MSSSAPPHRIAVYGSLLEGLSNHDVMERARGRKVATGLTQPAFTMLDLGAFPAIIAGKGQVKVEVYEVPAERLFVLDKLEGHPDLYVRTPVTLADGSPAEIYVLKSERVAGRQRPVVASGDWRTYLETVDRPRVSR